MQNIDTKTAKNILSDVPSDKCFWVNKGPVLKNLRQLRDTLERLSAETFRHHVNEKKNDFVNWIRDVIKDQTLAQELALIQNQRETFRAVDKRVNELEETTRRF